MESNQRMKPEKRKEHIEKSTEPIMSKNHFSSVARFVTAFQTRSMVCGYPATAGATPRCTACSSEAVYQAPSSVFPAKAGAGFEMAASLYRCRRRLWLWGGRWLKHRQRHARRDELSHASDRELGLEIRGGML